MAGVHIVGRRDWNRRGAMVTDRYLHVRHHDDVASLAAWCAGAGLPLIGITLIELGAVGPDSRQARKWHAIAVGVFLVLAHVAMIFGMLDPAVLGWGASHVMPDGGTMPGMHH